MRMEQVHETIDSARDYRGALMADYLKRVWAALMHAPASSPDQVSRNHLARPASNTVSPGHR
jgi:hypothetical protein